MKYRFLSTEMKRSIVLACRIVKLNTSRIASWAFPIPITYSPRRDGKVASDCPTREKRTNVHSRNPSLSAVPGQTIGGCRPNTMLVMCFVLDWLLANPPLFPTEPFSLIHGDALMSDEHVDPIPPPVPQRYRNRADAFLQDAAPPLTKPPQSGRWRLAKTLLPSIGVQTTEEDNGPNLKQQSTSWGTSLLIHAALLFLITLLVAPANLGNEGVNTIQLQLSELDDRDKQPSLPVEIATPETQSLSDPEPETQPPVQESVEPEATESKPAPATVSLTANTTSAPIPKPTAPLSHNSLVGHQSASPTDVILGGAPVEKQQAKGSFFGISADGYDFVYVLDRSTSMHGHRFKRAVAEVIRSVKSLNEDQNFYVFLFGKTTIQLYGKYQRNPKCVPATDKNKARLEEWLHETRAAGNTDPREALYLAFAMKPSAIFMLSDGEFTDDRPQVSKLSAVSGNTFDLVSKLTGHSSVSSTPIHAIAFEDPKSKKNMERLAVMTGGTYLYVPVQVTTNAELLADAKKVFAQSRSEDRSQKIAFMALRFRRPNVGARTRRSFAALLETDARQALNTHQFEPDVSHLEVAYERLRQLDRMRLSDQEHVERCERLLETIIQEWQSQGREVLTARLTQLSGGLSQPTCRERAVDALGEVLFETAEQLENSGDRFGAYALYRRIASKYSNAHEAEESLTRCKETEAEIELHTQEIVDEGKIAEAIRYLRQGVADSKQPETQQMWQQAVKGLVYGTLAKARDAGMSRDEIEQKLTLRQLTESFDDENELMQYQRQFAQDESMARTRMNSALKMQRRLHPKVLGDQLRQLIHDFPHTLGAQQAARYLPEYTQ